MDAPTRIGKGDGYGMEPKNLPVVLISADAEWRSLKPLFPDATCYPSPYGDWFLHSYEGGQVVYFHGGWGKIAAAGSTQYALDLWQPSILVNLGTCGGFEGSIERGEIILVERTVVYDIIEQMGDYDEHIAHYATDLDLSWLPAEPSRLPHPVVRTLLVSGDRDLLVEDIPRLRDQLGAQAGDWESGAIAFVAGRNDARLVILRGVTDLVGPSGGEAYGNMDLFQRATDRMMTRLVEALPEWLALALSTEPW